MVDIGYSRFGDLNGVMQTMADAQGRQVLELIRRFSLVVWSDGKHHVLEPNEGIRSRPRQLALRNAYLIYKAQGHPYAALAAVCYTSNHDATHADAVDFGRDGGQALNGEYLTWVRANGPILGIFPDGMSFSSPESWHFGSYPSRAKQIPPTTITWRDAIYTPPADPDGDDMSTQDRANAAAAMRIAFDPAQLQIVGDQVKAVYAARLGREPDQQALEDRVALALSGYRSIKDQDKDISLSPEATAYFQRTGKGRG